MGKTQVQEKTRRKALASRKTIIHQKMTKQEEIADCRARIRLCESDMAKTGQNNLIDTKIAEYKKIIARLETEIMSENTEKEVI